MKKLKKYTEEFKNEAVKLVTEQGYSQAAAAESLGINNQTLSRWVTDFRNGKDRKHVKTTPEQEEIKRLNKEVQRLRLEREILKKAAAFFANEKL